MKQWICSICGYIYDITQGDPTQDIDPGISFYELPDEWVCPECGASKDSFSEIEV